MFHAGHVKILEEARSYGDYVIVGVLGDHVVNALRGHHFPIMNLNERVLSVLGCKYVDDVLIDAPYVITKEMIQSMHVSVVLTGKPLDSQMHTPHTSSATLSTIVASTSSSSFLSPSPSIVPATANISSSNIAAAGMIHSGIEDFNRLLSIDPFVIPRQMGILETLNRKNTMSIFDIISKIEEQKESLQKKFNRKRAQEQEFYARKYGNII